MGVDLRCCLGIVGLSKLRDLVPDLLGQDLRRPGYHPIQRSQKLLRGQQPVGVETVVSDSVHNTGPAAGQNRVGKLIEVGSGQRIVRKIRIGPQAVIVGNPIEAIQEVSQIITVERRFCAEVGPGLASVGHSAGEPPIHRVFQVVIVTAGEIGEIIISEEVVISAAGRTVRTLSGRVIARLDLVSAGFERQGLCACRGHKG